MAGEQKLPILPGAEHRSQPGHFSQAARAAPRERQGRGSLQPGLGSEGEQGRIPTRAVARCRPLGDVCALEVCRMST